MPRHPQTQVVSKPRGTRYKDPTYTPQEKSLLDFFKKLPHAEQVALQEQASKPKPPIGSSALMDLILEYKQVLKGEGKARHTVEGYSRDLVSFYRFTVGEERDVTEMSPALVLAYCEFLARQKNHPNTVSRKLHALKGFLPYLRQQGVLDRAQLPPAQLFRIKTPKAIPNYLTTLEIKRLLEAPDPATMVGIRDRAILEVLYGAGLRVSELVALDVSDLELRYKTLLVRDGKGGTDRWARYGTPARRALIEYLREARPELEQCTPAGHGFRKALPAQPREGSTGALFLNRYGQRLSVRTVQKLIKEYAKIVGIDRRVYPHLLRHSMATHLLENGASLPVIKELLGHMNVSTTQVYTHVSNTEAKASLLKHHPRARPANDLLDALLKRRTP